MMWKCHHPINCRLHMCPTGCEEVQYFFSLFYAVLSCASGEGSYVVDACGLNCSPILLFAITLTTFHGLNCDTILLYHCNFVTFSLNCLLNWKFPRQHFVLWSPLDGCAYCTNPRENWNLGWEPYEKKYKFSKPGAKENYVESYNL